MRYGPIAMLFILLLANTGKAEQIINEPPLQPEAVVIDYGNWCGYNNTREDPNYPVKDEVDAVCRTHDLCIRGYGYHDCRCDAAFLEGMATAKASTWQGEAYRQAAILVFEAKPCVCTLTVDFDGIGGRCRL